MNVRLERIEELRRGEAPTRALLDELRGLLEDGEAWLGAVAKTGPRATARASLRGNDDRAKEVTPKGQTRTLI